MMTSTAEKLRETVDQAAVRLLGFSEGEASRVPAPGKWSRKEILGHLIDSAANNHARFVRAQSSSDLVFEGYDQDEWVRVQRYRDRPWKDLVELWRLYNHHIAFVMAATGEGARMEPRARHSLDRIAFNVVPASQPATLDYLMRDYVDHLEHHLRQILVANS
jgi:DinB superfamily